MTMNKNYLHITFILFSFIAFLSSGCATDSKDSVKKEAAAPVETMKDSYDTDVWMRAAKRNNFSEIKIMLQKGFDINTRDQDGKTALDYAFMNDHFETYKILLENGAETSSVVDFNSTTESKDKRKMYILTQEYDLYQRILNRTDKDDLKIFDLYFSLYPQGFYTVDVERMLETIVKKDYEKIESTTYVPYLKSFVDKYSQLGKNGYVITSTGLHARKNNTPYSEVTGYFREGDRVYAAAKKDGWLKTNKGWINAVFTENLSSTIPVLTPYLSKISQKLARTATLKPVEPKPSTPKVIKKQPQTLSKPAEKKIVESSEPTPEKVQPAPKEPQAEPAVEKIEEKPAQLKETVSKPGPASPAEKELDIILQDPTLEKLEIFIRKYESVEKYKYLVERARIKYKSILLGE